jgi:peptide/nickel transport system substrate-binding protein
VGKRHGVTATLTALLPIGPTGKQYRRRPVRCPIRARKEEVAVRSSGSLSEVRGRPIDDVDPRGQRRRNMRRSRVSSAAVICALGSVVGSGVFTSAASAANQSGTNPVLTVGIANAPNNLNPADNASWNIMNYLTYAELMRQDPAGSVEPGLATSWSYIGHGDKTFEFTLRSGVHFSDGELVTAAAVKTWFLYFLHDNGPEVSSFPISSVSTAGSTVTLHLSASDPLLPYQLSNGDFNLGFIASPGGVADPTSLAAGTDGAGPYRSLPSQSVAGSEYVFVPNSYYSDQSAIRFSKIIFKVIPTASTMLAALESGEIGVGEGDATTATAAASSGLNVVAVPTGFVGLLVDDRSTSLAGKPNPLSSVAVRQAMNYALNRKAITSGILGKWGTPTSEVPTTDGWVPTLQNYFPYDPAKAKKLLASAGYAKGFTLNVISQTSLSPGDTLAQAMAQDFSAIGITLNITSEPTVTEWVSAYETEKFPASEFLEASNLPQLQQYNFFLAPGPSSIGNWADPKLDNFVHEGMISSSPGQYWKAISTEVTTQGDEIPVAEPDEFWYANKDVGGIAYSAANYLPNPIEWFLKS